MLMVRNLLSQVVAFYPPELRAQAEPELPEVALQASRLALEVMHAEANGVRFYDAVLDPEYPLMGRLYFGMSDMLQWRLPPALVEAVRTILEHVARGDFDPARKVLFAIAKSHEPEAALCRFLFWASIRLNLLVATWQTPEFEEFGVLDAVEDEAESILRELLDVPELDVPDVRPLEILVAEALTYATAAMRGVVRTTLEEFGEEVWVLVRQAEARAEVRMLEAKDAAMFAPGRSNGPIGSQQIADRYPDHFVSANAMEQRRSRFLSRPRPVPSTDRLIDIVLESLGGER